MSTRLVGGSPSRTANLSPMLRWQRHARMRCHKFASGSPPDSTTSGRKLSLTTLQTMLSSVPSPAKRKQDHCLHERQRGGSVSFVARNELHKEQECMWAKVQEDESERRTAHVLHCSFTQPQVLTLLGEKTRFCFCSPRMKLVQQGPRSLTVHTTSGCCWELKTRRLIPSVWAERGAFLPAPIPQGKELRP